MLLRGWLSTMPPSSTVLEEGNIPNTVQRHHFFSTTLPLISSGPIHVYGVREITELELQKFRNKCSGWLTRIRLDSGAAWIGRSEVRTLMKLPHRANASLA